ncbi:hypothetical protein COCNU_08G006830 [Cocos nucifera]|uniref:Uncharacterized protein n=1 Tax=Cocos nucifera TaxID=13894 RepID=A0A8K0IIB6_COCNU|nr:hypothetical protein COCNU_08G006830 [Cocos nucifera]
MEVREDEGQGEAEGTRGPKVGSGSRCGGGGGGGDRWTRGATRIEKLEEWRRAHPRERMRIVIPPEYVMLVERHVRDPYMCKLSFDIWDDCLENSDMSSISTGRRSSRHVGQWRYAYCDKASQSRSRLMVMHYGGSKSFAQYQF